MQTYVSSHKRHVVQEFEDCFAMGCNYLRRHSKHHFACREPSPSLLSIISPCLSQKGSPKKANPLQTSMCGCLAPPFGPHDTGKDPMFNIDILIGYKTPCKRRCVVAWCHVNVLNTSILPQGPHVQYRHHDRPQNPLLTHKYIYIYIHTHTHAFI